MILKWFTVIVLVVMGLGNLWIAGEGTYKSSKKIWLGYYSENWPTVIGVIELSNVTKYPTSKRGVAYKPEIYYSYQVGRGLYTSNQVEFTMFGYDLNDATEICNKFQRGELAIIHYQEDNPQISSLITGVKWDVYLALFVGVFWFLPAVVILLFVPVAYQKPAGDYKPEYIAALKSRFNWRGKSKPNIWKPPAKL